MTFFANRYVYYQVNLLKFKFKKFEKNLLYYYKIIKVKTRKKNYFYILNYYLIENIKHQSQI
jgi:hypothetical protein